MKHKAVFWVGGSIHTIIESKNSRQFAINVRNQIVQMTLENEHSYSIEITHTEEDVITDAAWKRIL